MAHSPLGIDGFTPLLLRKVFQTGIINAEHLLIDYNFLNGFPAIPPGDFHQMQARPKFADLNSGIFDPVRLINFPATHVCNAQA